MVRAAGQEDDRHVPILRRYGNNLHIEIDFISEDFSVLRDNLLSVLVSMDVLAEVPLVGKGVGVRDGHFSILP